MADKTYKHMFDDGYTTYHDDGTKSESYKHMFDDGYTTYHGDGSRSDSYRHAFDDGYTTYHSEGGKSDSYKHMFDDGYTTYHSNGGHSDTYKDYWGDGYTTYHSGNQNTNYYSDYGNYNSSSPISTYGGTYGGYYSGSAYIDYESEKVKAVRKKYKVWYFICWIAFVLLTIYSTYEMFFNGTRCINVGLPRFDGNLIEAGLFTTMFLVLSFVWSLINQVACEYSSVCRHVSFYIFNSYTITVAFKLLSYNFGFGNSVMYIFVNFILWFVVMIISANIGNNLNKKIKTL